MKISTITKEVAFVKVQHIQESRKYDSPTICFKTCKTQKEPKEISKDKL